MSLIQFTYEVTINSTWETSKTFTFDSAVLCGICAKWARLSCCPGSTRITMVHDSSTSSISIGSVSGQHYQSGIGTNSFFSRRVISEVRLETFNNGSSLNCGGANGEIRVCIVMTDFCISDNCVCDANCSGSLSYVDI